MKQVLGVSNTRTLPSWRQFKQLPSVLSTGEKQLITSASWLIAIAIVALVGMYIFANRVIIPAVGGTYTEGLIGEPQFINPLYARANDVDQDLASLVYSGLIRWDQNNGFIPDLAESIEINEDGTVYTLKIKDHARFHNGEDVRARDVLFTFNAIQTPTYRSPLAAQFADVTIVQVDDKTVQFILTEPFTPFIEYLDVGIMPASLWSEILPQNIALAAFNLQPIGAGPYKFKEFAKDKKGVIRSYTLERNEDYHGSAPHIEELTFKFYQDTIALTDALNNKNVEGISFVPFDERPDVREQKDIQLQEPLMHREVVLYFNQDVSPVLEEYAVREAIAASIDKQSIVTEILAGHGQVIHAPILPSQVGHTPDITDTFDPLSANSTLDEAGFERQSFGEPRLLTKALTPETVSDTTTENTSEDEEATDEITDEETEEEVETTIEEEPSATEEPVETNNTLSLTLTTAQSPEMIAVAEAIKEDLMDVGIEIRINPVASELLFTEVIAPRAFEILLTAIQLSADPDPYPLWHSDNNSESGLNIAGYENDDVDTLIDEARVEVDTTTRTESYQSMQERIAEDLPAVFIYQSTYAYAVLESIQGIDLQSIVTPSHRFNGIEHWYLKTKKALK